jgi:hypothetical protein
VLVARIKAPSFWLAAAAAARNSPGRGIGQLEAEGAPPSSFRDAAHVVAGAEHVVELERLEALQVRRGAELLFGAPITQ